MFGDMGHGAIILAFGLFLTIFHEKLKKTFWATFAPGRYLLVLLGMQSVFCGLIYNEFFALRTNIIGSCYNINEVVCINKVFSTIPVDDTKKDKNYIDLCPAGLQTFKRYNVACTYPLGLDPGLGISGGELDLGNRIKMKTAIFYALVHMTIGLILSGFNNLHKNDKLSFFTETIMAILILWCMIGYICPYYIIKFFTNPELDQDNGKASDEPIFVNGSNSTTVQYDDDKRTNVVGILSYLSSSFMAFSYVD